MVTCFLCEKSLDAGDNDGHVHNVCDAIWQDRKQRDMCTTCGENQAVPDTYRCDSCHWNARILGFAGP